MNWVWPWWVCVIGALWLLVAAGEWALRARLLSTKRDCKTCAYNKEGACRRYPPQRVYTGPKSDANPEPVDVSVFPVVANADGWWCGEYRRRP